MPPQCPQYDLPIETALKTLVTALGEHPSLANASPVSLRRYGLNFLEGSGSADLLSESVQGALKEVRASLGEDTQLALAMGRFRWAKSMSKCVISSLNLSQLSRITRRLDRVFLHKMWGGPIFLGMMYLTFQFSITFGGFFQGFFDQLTDILFVQGSLYLGSEGFIPQWLSLILAHGLGLGISTVVSFIPQVAGLLFFLSFLEFSGYISRATFLLEFLFSRIGLPGQSFTALIVGFGCNVPSILGTRVIGDSRARLTTIIMSPFMSCGARLTIYMVISRAFFPSGGALVVFSLYLLGIFAAVGTGFLMRHAFRAESFKPIAEELPYYHIPALRTVVTAYKESFKTIHCSSGQGNCAHVFINRCHWECAFGREVFFFPS